MAFTKLKILIPSDIVGNSLQLIVNHCPALTHLDLRENNSGDTNLLEPSYEKLINLTFLNLSWNHMRELSPQISVLTKLTYLDLSDNLLNEPDSLKPLSSLTNLRSLDLRENFIEKLPSQISALVGLTNLNLGRNILMYVDPSLSNVTKLTNLQTLNLENSATTAKIKSINIQLSSDFSKFPSLTELYLSYYDFIGTSSLDTILKLSNLLTLSIVNSNINSFPPEFGNFIKLKRLDLRGTDSKDKPSANVFNKVFYKLIELKEVNMDKSNLKEIYSRFCW
ncbi:MAG: hypothetical protein BGO77_03245 [Caedibacter sp. 37-49]|nr:MAG: hypothetical protein BGO77_03245 [Caedibacter sp. 37-49]